MSVGYHQNNGENLENAFLTMVFFFTENFCINYAGCKDEYRMRRDWNGYDITPERVKLISEMLYSIDASLKTVEQKLDNIWVSLLITSLENFCEKRYRVAIDNLCQAHSAFQYAKTIDVIEYAEISSLEKQSSFLASRIVNIKKKLMRSSQEKASQARSLSAAEKQKNLDVQIKKQAEEIGWKKYPKTKMADEIAKKTGKSSSVIYSALTRLNYPTKRTGKSVVKK